MPNNLIKIWEMDPEEIELQNQIRIVYHRLKEKENNQVLLIDAYNYYRGISNIRPNLSFERIE
jgi:thymidylate kinase